jgi:hypothetical protein
MVMHGEFRHVAQPPPPSSQIHGEQFFFAANKKTRLKAAGLHECGAADHRSPGEKTQERPARHIGRGR